MMESALREDLMTVEEFLDWHPEGEKWELVGGIPWQMMSEGNLHERVKSNVHVAVGKRMLPPSSCQAAVDGRQVRIDATTSYRPDVSTDCAPSSDPMLALIEKPTVVFEVGVTTLIRDKMEKRANYFLNPDVEHVVVVDANARTVHRFRRGSAREDVLRAGDTLALDGAVTLDVPVAEFFHFLT